LHVQGIIPQFGPVYPLIHEHVQSGKIPPGVPPLAQAYEFGPVVQGPVD